MVEEQPLVEKQNYQVHHLLQLSKTHPFFAHIGQAVMSFSPIHTRKPQRNPWSFKLLRRIHWAHLSAWSRVFRCQIIEELQVSIRVYGGSPAIQLANLANLLRFLRSGDHVVILLIIHIEEFDLITPLEYEDFRGMADECSIKYVHVQNTLELDQAIIPSSPIYHRKHQNNTWSFFLDCKLHWARVSTWSRRCCRQVIENFQVSFYGDSPASQLVDFTNVLRFLRRREHIVIRLVIHIEEFESVTSEEHQDFRNMVDECGIQCLHVQNMVDHEDYEGFPRIAETSAESRCTLDLLFCQHNLHGVSQVLHVYADAITNMRLRFGCTWYCGLDSTVNISLCSLIISETLWFPLLEKLSIEEHIFAIDSVHSILCKTPLISHLSIIPSRAHVSASKTASKPTPRTLPSIYYPAVINSTAAYAEQLFEGLAEPSPSSKFTLLLCEEISYRCPNLDFLERVSNVNRVVLPPSQDGRYFLTSAGVSCPQVKSLSLKASKAPYCSREQNVSWKVFPRSLPGDSQFAGNCTLLSPYLPKIEGATLGVGEI